MCGQEVSCSNFQENVYNTDTFEKAYEVKDVILAKIIKKLSHRKKLKLLDIGCGDGGLIGQFDGLCDCYGVDVSEVQLRKAELRGIRTCQVDLENNELPFENEFFDAVVCSETIEHLLNIDNLMQEIHRILKLGGTFILTFPNVNQPISWPMQIIYDLPPRFSARYKSPHVRDYTLRMVRNVLADFRFDIIDVRGTYIYPFKGGFSRWIAGSFPRLAEKIIVVSKKNQKTLFLRKPPSVVWSVLGLVEKKGKLGGS